MARTISTKLAVEGEAQYKQAIASCNSQLSTLKSSLALVESSFKGNANSMEALTAKGTALGSMYEKQKEKVAALESALKNCQRAQEEYAARVQAAQDNIARCEQALAALGGAAGDTSEEQKALTAELDRWNAELAEAEAGQAAAERGVQNWQKQLNYANVDLNKLDEELAKNAQYLAEAEQSADGCAQSIDEYGNEAKEAADASDEFGSTSKNAVDTLAQALVAAGLAEKVQDVAKALMDCVDTFAAFEAQMSTVQAISGATADEMQLLNEKAKEMGATTSFTATEAGQALEYMAMAGWGTNEMLEGIDGIMNLAAASGESLATVSDIVTDSLTAFGLTASDSAHYVDVLAAAATSSNTNVSMMGETFKYVAPSANTLKYSVEDVALSVGLIANNGIKASQAGTSFNSILTRLATDAGASSKSLGALGTLTEQLGVQFYNANGSTRDWIDVLRDSRAAWAELTIAEQENYAKKIAGQEAIGAWSALMKASEADFAKLSAAINDCSGAAEKMAGIRLDNYAGQLQLLDSAVDGLKMTIGGQLAPVLERIAEGATTVIGGVDEILERCPLLSSMLAGLVVSGTALTAAFAGFSILETVTPALKAFNAALAANPAGAAAIAIVGVVAALGTLAAYFADAADGANGLNREMRGIEQSYQKAATETAATATAAEGLIDKLAQLEAQESMTEGETALYHQTVEKLKALLPELNIEIDEQTGLLAGGAEALRANTEAWKENALAQALQEKYQAVLSAQADALVAAAEKQLDYNDALATCTGLEKDMLAVQEEIQRIEQDASMSADEKAARINELIQQMGLLNDQYILAKDSLAAHGSELSGAQEKAAAFDEELNRLNETEKQLTLTTSSSAESYREVEERAEAVQQELAELQVHYDEVQQKAYESINEQIGLFEKMDGEAKTSIASLIESLQSQVTCMDAYAENIKKAMEKGVNEGLIKALSDGSEQSAQILDAIVKGGEEDISSLNAELAKVEEGKQNFSETVRQMYEEFDGKMDEFVGSANETMNELKVEGEMQQIGSANIDGLIQGMNSREGELIARARSIANNVSSIVKKALDIH